MGTPLGPKYIPYTYMDPLGEVLGSLAKHASRTYVDAIALEYGKAQRVQVSPRWMLEILHDPNCLTWGFPPKSRCTFLRFPIIWTTVFWGLYWGPLILGNCQIYFRNCGIIVY